MNERIYELIRLSAVPADQSQDYALAKGLIEPAEKLDVAKFAELIVAECMEVCRRGKYDGRDDMSLIQFNNGIRFCMNAIDEHFGVENAMD